MDYSYVARDTLTLINRENLPKSTNYYPEDIKFLLKEKREKKFHPEINILFTDTISAAQRLTKTLGEDLCVLNFASATRPGGAFLENQKAGQEESLCRSTSLFAHLENSEGYSLSRKNDLQSLYHDWVVFSPGIEYFKDSKGQKLENPFKTSIISCAAPNARKARRKNVDSKTINIVMRKRIEAVLSVASLQNQRHLLLGSWGTGCFGNSIYTVAKAFRESLRKYNFKSITFSLISERDFQVFKKIFNC